MNKKTNNMQSGNFELWYGAPAGIWTRVRGFLPVAGVERPLYLIPSRFDRSILPEHWTRLLAFEVYFRSSNYSVADRSVTFILPVEVAKDFFIAKVLKLQRICTDCGMSFPREEAHSAKLVYG
jgi:hypothetical protein